MIVDFFYRRFLQRFKYIQVPDIIPKSDFFCSKGKLNYEIKTKYWYNFSVQLLLN